jgi:hypothetical protein
MICELTEEDLDLLNEVLLEDILDLEYELTAFERTKDSQLEDYYQKLKALREKIYSLIQ